MTSPRSRRLLSSALAAASTFAAAPTWAAAEAHDGFYFNGQLGVGGSRVSFDGPLDLESAAEGGTVDLSLDLGAAFTPHLVGFVRLSAFVQPDPEIDTGTVTFETDDDVSLRSGFLGVGGRYYFMPSNAYVGLALGLAQFTLKGEDAATESDVGFGFAIEGGKEWWVGREWALGVGGRFSHHAADNLGAGVDVSGNALAVLFSATYN